MPSRAKVLGDGAIRGQKALRMPGGFKPLHAILALARGPMRVLTAVVEIAALTVFDPRQYLSLRRAVALQLVCNDDAGNIGEALKELTKKLLGGLLIAPALDQDVEHMIVLVDSAPQVMTLAINRQEDLVQVPFVAWLGASTFQPTLLLDSRVVEFEDGVY